MKGSKRAHQEGAALFVAVMVLALMGALGIMAFNTVLVDRQVAGLPESGQDGLLRGRGGCRRGSQPGAERRIP